MIQAARKGIFAIANIPEGTRILSESPILKLPRHSTNYATVTRPVVGSRLSGQNDNEQGYLKDLINAYHCRDGSRPLGNVQTNCLYLDQAGTLIGIFVKASRLNHSCNPNAWYSWNDTIGQLNIHAVRNIRAGEEVTISYLTTVLEYSERQLVLRERFKFSCKCKLCLLPPEERENSDSRLRKLAAIGTAYADLIFAGRPDKALPILHTMLLLFDAEDIRGVSRARAYHDAYGIAITRGDKARAFVFAERSYNIRRVIEGDDSRTATKIRQCTEELLEYSPEVKRGEGFENWLWMLDEHWHATQFPKAWPPSLNWMDSTLDWQRIMNSLSYGSHETAAFAGKVSETAAKLPYNAAAVKKELKTCTSF